MIGSDWSSIGVVNKNKNKLFNLLYFPELLNSIIIVWENLYTSCMYIPLILTFVEVGNFLTVLQFTIFHIGDLKCESL